MSGQRIDAAQSTKQPFAPASAHLNYPLTAAQDALASFTKSAGMMGDVTVPLAGMTGSKSNQDDGVTA
jgi:hypothetical protein